MTGDRKQIRKKRKKKKYVCGSLRRRGPFCRDGLICDIPVSDGIFFECEIKYLIAFSFLSHAEVGHDKQQTVGHDVTS
jgi:hypothetical protein